MRPTEIIAVILAIIILVKAIWFAVNRKSLFKLADKMIKKTTLMLWLEAIFAVVIGWFVFTSIYIADVAAVMMFSFALIGAIFFVYPKSYKTFVKEMEKDPKKLWALFAFWIVFAVVVLLTVL